MSGESTTRRLVPPILLAVAVLGGCAKPYDPFQVPREEARERIADVAMVPAQVSSFVMDPLEARATFEVPATRRLERAGIRVIPSETWQTLWNQAAMDLGGVYDPSTGRPDSDRYKLAREAVYRALKTDHGADAVLYLSIHTLDLYMTGAKPSFCGGEGGVYFPGRGFPFGTTTLVHAACLHANLYDLDRRYLYGIRHALEVIETYAQQTRAVRSRAARFRNTSIVAKAIEAVIGPLAENAADGR